MIILLHSISQQYSLKVVCMCVCVFTFLVDECQGPKWNYPSSIYIIGIRILPIFVLKWINTISKSRYNFTNLNVYKMYS